MRPKKEAIGPELQCAVYEWLTTEAWAWTSRKAHRSLKRGLEDRWVIKSGKGYSRARHGGANLRPSGTTWVDSISTLLFPLKVISPVRLYTVCLPCQTVCNLSPATIRLESGTFLSQALVIKLHTPLSGVCLFYAGKTDQGDSGVIVIVTTQDGFSNVKTNLSPWLVFTNKCLPSGMNAL